MVLDQLEDPGVLARSPVASFPELAAAVVSVERREREGWEDGRDIAHGVLRVAFVAQVL